MAVDSMAKTIPNKHSAKAGGSECQQHLDNDAALCNAVQFIMCGNIWLRI